MLAITVDYGPFGFVEAYDPQFVPNYSDKQARYCFNRQLEVCIDVCLILNSVRYRRLVCLPMIFSWCRRFHVKDFLYSHLH